MQSDSLEKINEDILLCQRCELRSTATQPVCGLGRVGAKYFLLGEAPGAQEDLEGIPFIGMAGKKLDKLIKIAGLDVNDCYFSNTCRCRPPGNRNPKKKEIKSCEQFLWRELLVVRPEYLITLGSVPLSLFSTSGVSNMHGTSFEYEIKE